MKKVLSFLLALALCAGLSVPALAAGFSDVPPGHYAASAIDACVSRGVVSGYADGSFQPAAPVTRAQFCVMIARAFYSEELNRYETAENKAQGWFVPAVKCLYFYAPYGGILSETSFEEDYLSASAMSQPINRYDMAQMLGAVLLYGRIEAQDSQKSAAHTKIGDWSAVPPIYQSAVASCYALGIIGGQSDGTFGGNNTMNRAQGCVVIHRMLSLANGGTIPQPSTPAETPTQSGVGTLANGKPITEENVLEIIEQIKLQYPSGMEWNSNTHRTGLPSAAANKLQGLYWSSNMGGCGGFASLVSDTIFGAGDANPIRKVPFTEMRPGDILIKCSPDGKCMHWTTAASRITGTDSYDFDDPSIGSSEDMPGGMNYLYLATTYGGNESSHVRYGLNSLTETPQPAYPYYYEVWTRYPE